VLLQQQCKGMVLVGEQLLLTVRSLKLQQQLLLRPSSRSACSFVVQMVFWQQQQQRLGKPCLSIAADL
jgi:hypothetical protein